MNELQIFSSMEFGQVRTIEIDGKPYFMASDIAKALGYARPNDAIQQHCRATVKRGTPISGKIQEVNFIPEGDMYRLISHSRLESAERFESWIFDEVIPSIRKHGAYMTENVIKKALAEPDFLIQIATQLKEEREARIKAQEREKQLGAENDLLTQKALEWADRPMINALVRAYAQAYGGDYSAAWKDFKKELLYRHGINLNLRVTNYLNKSGKKTKPRTLDMLTEDEIPQALSTATALCRERNIDISDILSKAVA